MNLLAKTTLIIATSIAMLGSAQAGGPMQNAKEHAEKAIAALQNATVDKGGHRVAAIKNLKAAIADIEAGIAFDKANDTKSEGKKKNK